MPALRGCLGLAAVVAVALLLQQAQARPGGKVPMQMSSSAILFYDCEFQPHYGQPISQCELLLKRAKETGSRSVNIVPTQYWIEESNKQFDKMTCYPDHWAKTNKVDYYCAKFEWDSPCLPFTKEVIDRFTAGLTDCIQKAHDLFDTVLLSPHLDDGTATMHWRNMLHFDPYWKDRYGFSYWDIMIKPLQTAVNAAYKQPGKSIWFSPQGEMGGTVFSYPASYLKVLQAIRSGFTGPKGSLKTGLLFNHAMLPGVLNRGEDIYKPEPDSPTGRLNGGWGPVKPFNQWPNYQNLKKNLRTIHQLFNASDYLGISNYARAGENPTVSDMESAIRKYDTEMKAMGFNLKKWRDQPGKSFIMNEFGLGGGISECGSTPSKTRAECGRFPWMGGTKSFAPEYNPWSNPVNRQYLKDYYAKAIEYSANGGDKFKVDGLYIWTIVSWDIFGIHPASSQWGGGATYAVPEVADMVKAHNAKF